MSDTMDPPPVDDKAEAAILEIHDVIHKQDSEV